MHNLKLDKNEFRPQAVRLGVYVVVVYEHSWWIGVVTEVNEDEKDVKIKFMHPKGPATYFNWPQRDNYCYFANTNKYQPFKLTLALVEIILWNQLRLKK